MSDERLPPGQTATRKFPVTGEKDPVREARNRSAWRLTVDGLVGTPLEMTLDDVLAVPDRELVMDVHCVTGWSHFGMRWGGFPLDVLLERAAPAPDARFVVFTAYSSRGHDTSLPLAVARRDTWLVHHREGTPLEPEHGGPLRTVTTSRYFYKSLKWVRRITLAAEDREGYWERESLYHNNADPWPGDERFKTGSLDPKRLEYVRVGERFDSYRGPGKLILSVDLRGWDPRERDLHDICIKNSDLRGAKLAGVDLRGANLSLCDLRGADLSGADCTGADLEGADFDGADLSGARLDGAALSATKLVGAIVAGTTWRGATGLLEDQEAYLLENAGG